MAAQGMGHVDELADTPGPVQNGNPPRAYTWSGRPNPIGRPLGQPTASQEEILAPTTNGSAGPSAQPVRERTLEKWPVTDRTTGLAPPRATPPGPVSWAGEPRPHPMAPQPTRRPGRLGTSTTNHVGNWAPHARQGGNLAHLVQGQAPPGLGPPSAHRAQEARRLLDCQVKGPEEYHGAQPPTHGGPQYTPQENNSPFSYGSRQTHRDLLKVAGEIRWNGENLPFVFFENQIRDMIRDCHNGNPLEILRAACQGVPREIVSQLNYPMPGLSEDQRIEKAIARLRLRFGAINGFLSERKIQDIRRSPKIANLNVASLKAFQEQLDLCEVYARAHGQMSKLDGKLVFEMTSKLPVYAKRKYLEFVREQGFDADEPTFDSLCEFIGREQNTMTSDLAFHLFETGDGRSAAWNEIHNPRPVIRVRQVNTGDQTTVPPRPENGPPQD